MRNRTFISSLLILAGCLFYLPLPAAAQGAAAPSSLSIQDLGSLDGAWCIGLGINDHDQVIARSSYKDGSSHNVLFSGSHVHDLGPSFVYGIHVGGIALTPYLNNRGHVAVTHLFSTGFHAALWQNGEWEDLGVLPGSTGSSAFGLNDRDEVIGYSQYGFYWSRTSGLVALAALSGDQSAEPTAIDNHGTIYGFSINGTTGTYTNVTWTGPTAIPTPLSFLAGLPAEVEAANAAGQIAGVWYDANAGMRKLFVWDATSGFQDLGAPPANPFPYFPQYSNIHLTDQGLLTANLFSYDNGFLFSDPIPLIWTASQGLQDLRTTGVNFHFVGWANNSGHLTGQIGPGGEGAGLAGLSASGALTTLGALPADWSYGGGFNNRGEAVGAAMGMGRFAADPGDSTQLNAPFGFFWNAQAGMSQLDSLGGSFSYPMALNDNGLAAGWASDQFGESSPAFGFGPAGTGNIFLSSLGHAVIWDTRTGVLTDLGVPAGYVASQARALNNDGWVTGTTWQNYFTNGYHYVFEAILYNPHTGALTTPLAGMDHGYSEGTGINNRGQITGAYLYFFYSDGFVYDIDSGKLTDIPDQYGNGTYPTAINDAGQVIGTTYDDNYAARAFLWTAKKGYTDLGDLTGGMADGGGSANASGINAYGQVVGTSMTAAGQNHGFITLASGGLLDLSALIPATSGWTVLGINGINDADQIYGEGLHNGTHRSLILTPRAQLHKVSLSAGRVKGGTTLTGTVTLSPSCPYDLFIKLASTNSAAKVPARVMVAANATTVTFAISTGAVKDTVTGQITGRFAGFTQGVKLTVTP